ncbi:MAG: hypothetical protein GF418_02020 [Chitinivibrionales bacterium]|nr:hypothetical protein [Chitinivibrionales bacterium]MBD3394377.1 hypothetical protein [Chitinivibrionales bacterium]
MRVRVVPRDGNTGLAAGTNWFALRNHPALTVVDARPDSLVTPQDARHIEMQFSHAAIDTATITDSAVSVTGSLAGRFGVGR